VGGSSIVLTPAAIFITGGPLVNINSGSGPPVAPASAALVPPAPPSPPDGAADASPGKDTSSQEKRHKDSTDEEEDKKSWVEIELVDEDDNPVPGEKYKVTLPDGKTVAEGTLDEVGYAKVSGIDPGTCKITFPTLDKDAWEKASGSGGSKKQTSGSKGSTQSTSESKGSTQKTSGTQASSQKGSSQSTSTQKTSGTQESTQKTSDTKTQGKG